MTVETVAKVIQIILAPVVMVTACGIMLGGLLGRFAAINDRLRALARERFDLLRAAPPPPDPADPFVAERLREIDAQIPRLLRRLQLAHRAVVAVYTAAFVFVLCMFVIAAAVRTNAAWIATAALVIFLAGAAALAFGLVQIVIEVRRSLDAIAYEVARVSALSYGRAPEA